MSRIFKYPDDFQEANGVDIDEDHITGIVGLAQNHIGGEATCFAASGNILVVSFKGDNPEEDGVYICKILKEAERHD